MGAVDDIKRITDAKAALLDAFADSVPQTVLDLLDEYTAMLQVYLQDAGALAIGELASLQAAGELTELLYVAGLDDLAVGLRTTLARLEPMVVAQLEAGGLTLTARTFDTTALDALVNMRVRQVAESVVQRAVPTVQQAWVESTFTGKPLPKALEQAAAKLQDTLPSVARTEVGTAVSSIDRAITAGVDEEDTAPAGDPTEKVYLYVGPSPRAGDKVTRPTCRVIVNKWATRAQIAQLDNGQIGDVLVTGGGWNCRHSWAPMVRAIAEAQGIPQITQADIARFNAGGSGRRKGKKK